MNIILERTLCTDKHTIGELSIDGITVGKTIEPVIIENAEPGESCAISEGTYEVKIVINPKSGTPTIKIYGKDVPHNLAIRARRPFSSLNVSPSFWDENNKEIDNILRWSQLLSIMLADKGGHTLTIIRNSPPSPPRGDVIDSE